MVVLSVSGVSKSFGVDTVLKDISFSVNEGDKVGVLGVNGAGKTTLFKMLTGEEQPDEGDIYISAKTGIAYMQQHAEYTSEKTAEEEVLRVFDKLIAQENKLSVLQKELETDPDDDKIKRFHDLQESFIDGGGLTYRARAHSALIGLGFSEEELSLPLSHISGGQRTRVLIAKLLLGEAKILLLDEPTNHLDVKAISWTEGFLKEYRGTVLVISHDRFFLDEVTDKTIEIEHNGVKTYGGNYSYYVKKKAEDREAAEKLYSLKQREIKRIEGIIAQQRTWSQERNYITIRSKQKSIDRIEKDLVRPDTDPAEIRFKFRALHGAGNDVLIMEDIEKQFDSRVLLKDVNIHIKRGERVFLLGDNGCGKTTLMRIIMGELMAEHGTSELGARVITGYFDQAQSDMLPDATVLDTVYDAIPGVTQTQIRAALAEFLFTGDDVFKNVRDLSGGERARVALCRLMLSGCNFLLLDEPTNHLDIPSKEALERALLDYDGTLLMISHDRYFINKLASKVYAVENNSVTLYNGNYDYYLTHRVGTAAAASAVKSDKPVNEYQLKKERESERRKLHTRFKRTEQSIMETEEKLKEAERLMADPLVAADYMRVTDIAEEAEALKKSLDVLYAEWDELSVLIEKEEEQC